MAGYQISTSARPPTQIPEWRLTDGWPCVTILVGNTISYGMKIV